MHQERAYDVPATLAAGQFYPSDIALDADWVYWTDDREGRVMRVPRTGGRAFVCATGEPRALAIAVDDEAIYWSTVGAGRDFSGGAIRVQRRLSRPGSARTA